MIIATLIIASVYVVFVFLLGISNLNLKSSTSEKDSFPHLSLLIPFRDEESNLDLLFKSIDQQNYPHDKLDIILVDDHSTDNSYQLAIQWMKSSSFEGQVLKLKTCQGKKKAIHHGMMEVSSDWVVSTDADCQMKSNWLQSIAQFIMSSDSNLIIGPVAYKGRSSIFQILLETELAALIASTSGAVGLGLPFMSNGANLIYKKELYHKVYSKRKDLDFASGDDVFFLHSAIKAKAKISFLNQADALVYTNSPKSLGSFINQRVRWAKKAGRYTNPMALFFGLLVLLMNCLILYSLLYENITVGLALFLEKLLLDYFLLLTAKRWIGLNSLFPKALLLSLVYPIYLLSIALLSLLYRPEWKGRKISS